MNIEEIQAKKRTLESAISETINRLIHDFEEDTGLTLTDLDFARQEMTSFSDTRRRYRYIASTTIII